MRLQSTVVLIIMLWGVSPVAAQRQIIVSGMVFDKKTDSPVPSVNVFIRGEKRGTVTDTTGKFRLELPSGRDIVLVFSHIAYQKVARLVRFDEQPGGDFHLALDPDTLRLQEYVIWGTRAITVSAAAKRRALFTLSEGEFEHLGEPDMDKALQYLLPQHVKPLSDRMRKPADDFTLYVNGEWTESICLSDIDPYDVRRVMVWEMLGGGIDAFPIGMPLRRGTYVISIETKR